MTLDKSNNEVGMRFLRGGRYVQPGCIAGPKLGKHLKQRRKHSIHRVHGFHDGGKTNHELDYTHTVDLNPKKQMGQYNSYRYNDFFRRACIYHGSFFSRNRRTLLDKRPIIVLWMNFIGVWTQSSLDLIASVIAVTVDIIIVVIHPQLILAHSQYLN